ncbi:hypothetical protein GCM10011507_09910 [Edaphobacter acidisoli]|uniref:DUF4142 domain-containing protein n=1 Tax=Edaphobacter acidisoli TaxID=2040573 RepID=A0A916RKU5_9BACT|nr:DUF4142 domain-containing protein [Edaphobacter acidisoli]GGA60385.1 hypothetical protein GCM10011507_09910 [Edaphobacter acidisoli]
MKSIGIRVVILGAAAWILPGYAICQMDSTAVLISSAQTSQPGQPASEQITPPSEQDSAQNATDNRQVVRDKMFLRGAAESGIAVGKFSQLAVEKSPSDDVRAFAQKMVDEHAKMNADLGRVADSLGIMMPKEMNKADKAEYTKLQSLSGSDFDNAYLSLMVREHHRAMREFRMESNTVNDASLREAVDKDKHVIHEHLVEVNKLAHDKGVPMPEHAHNPEPSPAPPSTPPSI